MSGYHLTTDDPVYGIEILLLTHIPMMNSLTQSGGEIRVSMKSYDDVSNNNIWDDYAWSLLSDNEDDINNGKYLFHLMNNLFKALVNIMLQ